MGGTRGVRIGYNPMKQSLFLRLPSERELHLPPIPYSELSIETVSDDSGIVMEISTQTVSLFSEFHRFAEIVTEIFEQPEQTAYSAFNLAIQKWRDLTSFKDLLTKDQQLGLFGELIFLHALIKENGPDSVIAWTGRGPTIPDRHDFRINTIDLEIKTTKSNQRIHIIHGLGQLQPSLAHLLFVLSIKLENAGLGLGNSLADQVKIIRSCLEDNIDYYNEFETRLIDSGYKDRDAEHYQEKLILSDLPVLIMIDSNCPRITREIISLSIPPEASGRISDVVYRVNFEGLGHVQGTKSYKNVLGNILL